MGEKCFGRRIGAMLQQIVMDRMGDGDGHQPVTIKGGTEFLTEGFYEPLESGHLRIAGILAVPREYRYSDSDPGGQRIEVVSKDLLSRKLDNNTLKGKSVVLNHVPEEVTVKERLLTIGTVYECCWDDQKNGVYFEAIIDHPEYVKEIMQAKEQNSFIGVSPTYSREYLEIDGKFHQTKRIYNNLAILIGPVPRGGARARLLYDKLEDMEMDSKDMVQPILDGLRDMLPEVVDMAFGKYLGDMGDLKLADCMRDMGAYQTDMSSYRTDMGTYTQDMRKDMAYLKDAMANFFATGQDNGEGVPEGAPKQVMMDALVAARAQEIASAQVSDAFETGKNFGRLSVIAEQRGIEIKPDDDITSLSLKIADSVTSGPSLPMINGADEDQIEAKKRANAARQKMLDSMRLRVKA